MMTLENRFTFQAQGEFVLAKDGLRRLGFKILPQNSPKTIFVATLMLVYISICLTTMRATIGALFLLVADCFAG